MANINIRTAANVARVHQKSGIQYNSVSLDMVELLAIKGSALAAADVIQLATIAENDIIFGGGVKTVTITDGTTLTLDMGLDGGDTLCDGVTADSGDTTIFGAAGSNGDIGFANPIRAEAAGVLTLTFKTLTGTVSTGEINVYWLSVAAQPVSTV